MSTRPSRIAVLLAALSSFAVLHCSSSNDATPGDATPPAAGDDGSGDDAPDAAAPACAAPKTACGGKCVDTSSDVANCGACGKSCEGANVGAATCKAGKCAVTTCAAGFSDCDGNASNGCEAKLATDGNNCGACGLTCVGGGCGAGKCLPLSLASAGAGAVVASATDLYWVSAGGVMKAPIGGGTASVFSAADASHTPQDLVIVGTDLYWTRAFGYGEIVSCPLAGCPAAGPKVFQSNIAFPSRIATDGTSIFFFENGPGTGVPGSLLACAISGCVAPTFLVDDTGNASTLAVKNGFAYFADNVGVEKITTAGFGNTPTNLDPLGRYAAALSVSDDYVYYSEYKSIFRVAVGGGTPELVGTSANAISTGMVLSGSDVIFSTQVGSIEKCAITGCPSPTILVAPSSGGDTSHLAVDSKALYWTFADSLHELSR